MTQHSDRRIVVTEKMGIIKPLLLLVQSVLGVFMGNLFVLHCFINGSYWGIKVNLGTSASSKLVLKLTPVLQ